MFLTKRLTTIACALVLASGAVHAQPKTSGAPHAQTASVRAPAANTDIGVPAAASATPSVAGAAASQPVAQPAPLAAATPHLSIEDVDQITRSKIARQLAGEGAPQSGGVTLSAPVPASAPPAVSVIKSVTPHQRIESVRFVGAFSDMSGPSVLYEFRGASYPAHVGAKLLNGWTVKRVDGFVVTVSDGSGKSTRTWTETISGGSSVPSDNPQPVIPMARALNDLGGPLPPSIPLSAMGQ